MLLKTREIGLAEFGDWGVTYERSAKLYIIPVIGS